MSPATGPAQHDKRDRQIQSTLCSVQRRKPRRAVTPLIHPKSDLIYKSQCQNLSRKFIFMVEHLNLFVPAHTGTQSEVD